MALGFCFAYPRGAPSCRARGVYGVCRRTLPCRGWGPHGSKDDPLWCLNKLRWHYWCSPRNRELILRRNIASSFTIRSSSEVSIPRLFGISRGQLPLNVPTLGGMTSSNGSSLAEISTPRWKKWMRRPPSQPRKTARTPGSPRHGWRITRGHGGYGGTARHSISGLSGCCYREDKSHPAGAGGHDNTPSIKPSYNPSTACPTPTASHGSRPNRPPLVHPASSWTPSYIDSSYAAAAATLTCPDPTYQWTTGSAWPLRGPRRCSSSTSPATRRKFLIIRAHH